MRRWVRWFQLSRSNLVHTPSQNSSIPLSLSRISSLFSASSSCLKRAVQNARGRRRQVRRLRPATPLAAAQRQQRLEVRVPPDAPLAAVGVTKRAEQPTLSLSLSLSYSFSHPHTNRRIAQHLQRPVKRLVKSLTSDCDSRKNRPRGIHIAHQLGEK